MDYYQISSKRYVLTRSIVLTYILLIFSKLLPSDFNSNSLQSNESCRTNSPITFSLSPRNDLDTQRFLEAVQEKEFDCAAIFLRQTPEIFQYLPPETQADICKAIELQPEEPIDQDTSKFALASVLLQNSPNLCQNFHRTTLRKFCNQTVIDPEKNSNLFKALVTYFLKNNQNTFYREFCLLATQGYTINHTVVGQLPKELKDFLLQSQGEPRLNNAAFEVKQNYSREMLCRHPAIHYDNALQKFSITSGEKTYSQPLLHHIIRHTDPKLCLQFIKYALLKGASHTVVNANQTDVFDFAKVYNPSCILFLQQYNDWQPAFNPTLISENDYKKLLEAYNNFMLLDQIEPLYNLLRPDITNPRDLSKLVLGNRACFINICQKEYISEKNFFLEAFVPYLYSQLLPILQTIKQEKKSTNCVEDQDTVFFNAIVQNDTKTVSTMCLNGYNINTFYSGSEIPLYYGSLPLWVAISEGHLEIIQILLKYRPSLELRPEWYAYRSSLHFALQAYFFHDKREKEYPLCKKPLSERLTIIRIILEHAKEFINRPEQTNKSLLEYAICDQAESKKRPNNMELISMLLELGADPYKISPGKHNSLEDLAASLGNKDLALWLSEYKNNHKKTQPSL
ncbi:MAG: ankyrin repeat domain-containing protein [Candidatus Babeliales bacterium]|jgi:hypothetical protein